MDNLQNSRRQSFLGLSQANKNISVLSEYSSNTQYHFKKSNNRISSKFLDHQTNLEKTNDFRNLNIIPFAKTRYSQLYFNSRRFYGRQNGINNANTSFKENVKEKSSSEKPSYSQNDVDDILIKFLESEKDKTNNRNICRGKLLEESSKKSVLCSRTDIDAVLKAFLNSKKTYDDSLSNESIKNLSFSEKYNSSDVSNVLSNQNISTKEEIPSDSPLNNFIIAQTTDSESFVTGISKELFDSKTRMKKHKNDVIHIFDYSENILSKDIIEEFLSSNRWDLIKHPYVMNFIDNRLIKKYGSFFDFLLAYLNLLIPFYFATILPSHIFTIFGIIEIIFYLLYLFYNIQLNNQLSFTKWFNKFNFITTTLYTKTLLYTCHLFIYSFKEYHHITNILLKELAKKYLILLLFSIPFSLIEKTSHGTFNRMIKKTIITVMGHQKVLLPISIITIRFFRYLLFFPTKSCFQMFPTFLQNFIWLISICFMSFQLTLSFILVILSHFFVFEDYEKLKHNPEEKVKHCIESLETVEKCTFFLNIFYNFLPPKLSNILVISSEKRILHNHFDSLLQIDSIESNPPISQEFFTTNDFNQTDQGTSENIEINMNESSNFNNSSKLEIFES